ncbi:MAG: PEP-CTERM sorting domain-containing protein [Phycisphaerales bacterium]|nr:PEP-CTERM sorting domain-containing protein [Phycisphaerales bacterium]
MTKTMRFSKYRFVGPLMAIAAAGLLSAFASPTRADVLITFEKPTYTTGTLAGQDGWSTSSSNSPGQVYTTATSGDYVGGQAARGYTGVSGQPTYIGTRALGESFGPTATISADFYASNGSSYLGGVGLAVFGMSNNKFYVRGGSTAITGDAATAGHWYHLTATFNTTAGTMTLTALDLTNHSSSVATGITSQVLPLGDMSSWNTIALRAELTAVDNIDVSVPEPAASALMVVAGAGLLLIRRRRQL